MLARIRTGVNEMAGDTRAWPLRWERRLSLSTQVFPVPGCPLAPVGAHGYNVEYRGVAQLVARVVRGDEVPGSSPGTPTTCFPYLQMGDGRTPPPTQGEGTIGYLGR